MPSHRTSGSWPAAPGRPLAGLPLYADPGYLRWTRRIAEEWAEVFELTPESLWDPAAPAQRNREFLREVLQASGRPCVAHGVSLSMGTPEAGRLPGEWQAYLANVRRDQADFGFAWWSDHLGFSRIDGLDLGLPLTLPGTEEAEQVVSENLRRLAAEVPLVAFENWAQFSSLQAPLEEGAFFGRIAARSGARLLLDLHNVWTHARNLGVDPDAYLDTLPLDQVLEIHLSGGSQSEGRWVPSGRIFTLDSHDGPVPEWAWAALTRILPECPALRAVILERFPASLDGSNVAVFEAEFQRLRGLLC